MMVTVAAVLPTVRPEMLATFLQRWGEHPETVNIPLVVRPQLGTYEGFLRVMRPHRKLIRDVRYSEERQPVWRTRMQAVADFDDVDVWINVDDDMEVIPGMTSYAPMIEMVQRPEIGVVSGARVGDDATLRTLWDAGIRADQPFTPPQAKLMARRGWGSALWQVRPICTMSGSMVWDRKLRPALVDQLDRMWIKDDVALSLTAYLCGYENRYYCGSVMIHRAGSKNGYAKLVRAFRHEDIPARYWSKQRVFAVTAEAEAAHAQAAVERRRGMPVGGSPW